MSLAIEDYAMIGDTRTVALVGTNGSVDWLCLPRFDSGACFAALLGDPRHGHWAVAPASGARHTVRRRYREDTLILETEFSCSDGAVRVIDCMPPDEETPNLLRLVEGVSGEVRMRLELTIRFDYGWIVPWVRRTETGLRAIGGPDALTLRTPVTTHGENMHTVADFTVRAGQRIPFALSWHPSNEEPPPPIDVEKTIAAAEAWWRRWARGCAYQGEWPDAVVRSLITLKGLTYTPTGGIVAAPTTSLPEQLAGPRNWDYRYAWLRDATFMLYALKIGGFSREACAWRDWLMRAVAGDPSQLQMLYGVAGERRLPELVLHHLPGYAGSSPVRIGNAAVHQLQLDVYGEVLDALYSARHSGLPPEPYMWHVERHLLGFLEDHWREPDEGLWEVRGPRQHFTHSKVMAWVGFDRAVKSVERLGLDGPVERWRTIRDSIHEEVCSKGFDGTKRAFTQAYGTDRLDASLLTIPLVGFLPASDPRVQGTVAAIERELLHDGLVLRYRTEDGVDGLPGDEGVFLLCSFWLADNYALLGRKREAHALFERLLSLRNDVGLLAEEYDPRSRRQLGNFPQAFSHVGLVNTAFNLSPRVTAPAIDRTLESESPLVAAR